MNQIKHSYIEVNGLNLHVAELGSESSQAVLFLHGFPEIWYTWRYQMMVVAKAGFRAIALDFRGYGLSDIPAEPDRTLFVDFVNDIASILDSLAISKVFLVGKDFGAMVAYTFTRFYPKKVAGVLTFGMPFMPHGVQNLYQALPEGFYVRRWQEHGRAEADFARFDVKTVVKNIYILFSNSELPIAGKDQEIMDLVEPSAPLPEWFTEEDLSAYSAMYEKSGFQTALKVPFRSFAENVEYPKQGFSEIVELAPKVLTPALLIIGEKDYVYKFPGMKEYLKSGKVKKYVPKLIIVYFPEGSHFIHEQSPDPVNQLLLKFLDCNKL